MDNYRHPEPKTDPNFEGSIWQELGHTDQLCPYCGAHLVAGDETGGLICLNACHLPAGMYVRFQSEMRAAASRVMAPKK